MVDQDERQHMLECEARHWLRRGYITPEKVAELKAELEKKRGAAAVEKLVAEMRTQWGIRREWLRGDHG
ncbi:hypothetical protein PHLH8_56780 [Pseudomonas sp. Pc102]|uniref:DUF7696 family protein n=1 Tax=Pseudomonas sp. Pc102 TaxID=2678261 RepID=UPI001BCCC85A|nr:hypothetical protein [Pseudomonas sp. Pc102]BBP86036.1 hypothetical protein PHLH8_56780 [Pseudomonas sp. Pc102]